MDKFLIWVSLLLGFSVWDITREAEFGIVVTISILVLSIVEFYFLHKMSELVDESSALTEKMRACKSDGDFFKLKKQDDKLQKRWEEFHSRTFVKFVFGFGGIFRILLSIYFVYFVYRLFS